MLKSFKDIEFTPHPSGNGVRGRCFFDNGYGISIIRFKMYIRDSALREALGRGDYGSYTTNEEEWELAVIEGNEADWNIVYHTPITSDVMGYLTNKDVERIMGEVQLLKGSNESQKKKSQGKGQEKKAKRPSKQLDAL